MQSPRGKNQVLTLKKSRERLYLVTCFALPILFISYHLGGHYSHTNLQVACTSTTRNHHHNHHNHKRPHILGDDGSSSYATRDEKTPQHTGEPRRRHRRHERLHDRAVYMAYAQSRINSSESLASSWFYQQDQPPILDQCCACDEAKYELVFEGLWSKYTHPEDFPENYWLAYFSDIIGASHSNDFRMWAQNSLASDGVRELAETGATKKLESELKQVSSKTRTIIKARELRYPTLNSKTSAVFRTDKHHHLVSILSKLGPSPDWMVGVSGLELCQTDCTWAAQRVVNLYLWDAGTDSGNSFMASDLPTRPQERIHPYRRSGGASAATLQLDQQQTAEGGGNSMSQYERNQKQSAQQTGPSDLLPVIDEMNINYNINQQQTSGSASPTMQEQMKPFARLTVTRQRIYEKSCSVNGAGGPVGDLAQPSTGNNRPKAYNQMTQHQQQHMNHLHPTLSADTIIEPARPSYSDCRFTDWSDWSSCSSTCGKGIRTRTRSFYDDQAHLTAGCSQSDLIEKEICLADCVGNASCVTHDWSEWSKCSVACGQGYRKRTRSPIGPLKATCGSIELAEMEQCTSNCDQADSVEADQPAPAQCAVTEWSQWSECSVACGRGTKIRTRQFMRKEDLENCANVRLLQKQSCTGRPELCKQVATSKGGDPFAQNGQHYQHGQHQNQKQINLELPVIDCKLSNWSPWSTCSALCGLGKRTRSRYIIQMPQNGGKPCDKKLSRTQRCKDLPPCPQDFPTSGPSDNSGSGRNSKSHGNQRQTTEKPGFGQYRTTASSTTLGMMDDEDDSKFSRLLKADMGHIQLSSNGWTSTESSYISDSSSSSVSTSTELELIGSSSFRIINGNTEFHDFNQATETPTAFPRSRYRTKPPTTPDYLYDDEDDRLPSRLSSSDTAGTSNFNFGYRVAAPIHHMHHGFSSKAQRPNSPKGR